MISFAIIEDDPEIREYVKTYLGAQESMLLLLDAGSVEEFVARVDLTLPPDVLILDIGLPGMSGLSAISYIKDKIPTTDIIMFTVHNDAHRIFEALTAGASGYLLKNTPLPQIKEALEQCYKGGAPMSPQIARQVVEFFNPRKKQTKESPITARENEIVIALVDGLSYKMIADRLKISVETVRHHIKNIYRKLQVNSKSEVVSKSLKGEI